MSQPTDRLGQPLNVGDWVVEPEGDEFKIAKIEDGGGLLGWGFGGFHRVGADRVIMWRKIYASDQTTNHHMVRDV